MDNPENTAVDPAGNVTVIVETAGNVTVETENGDESFSDEGDEKEDGEEETETLRFYLPLETCVDFRVITQQEERVLPPKRETDYYDLNDPFIDDEDLLVQEDDHDNPVEAFVAVAGSSDSEDDTPASKLPSELPTQFQRLAQDLERRVVALNLNPNNPGRVPEEIRLSLVDLEKQLQGVPRGLKQKASQYLAERLPWSAQTIRGHMRATEPKEEEAKLEARLAAELEQVLDSLEQRIGLDVSEFQLSLPFQLVGGNVKKKAQLFKYKVRWELFQELISDAVRLDEQVTALRNKRVEKAARTRSAVFQTIADFWPVAVNMEAARIAANFKKGAKPAEDSPWATAELQSITAKRFTTCLEVLVTANSQSQWVAFTALHANPLLRSVLDTFLSSSPEPKRHKAGFTPPVAGGLPLASAAFCPFPQVPWNHKLFDRNS